MNETKFTETDLHLMENSINEIEEERTKLVFMKREIESELTKLKTKVSGRFLPDHEYDSICLQQSDLVKTKNEIEYKISKLKSESKKLNTNRDHIFRIIKPSQKSTVTDKIEELKNKYLQFASDATRISSMRTMAAQIATELTSVINSI